MLAVAASVRTKPSCRIQVRQALCGATSGKNLRPSDVQPRRPVGRISASSISGRLIRHRMGGFPIASPEAGQTGAAVLDQDRGKTGRGPPNEERYGENRADDSGRENKVRGGIPYPAGRHALDLLEQAKASAKGVYVFGASGKSLGSATVLKMKRPYPSPSPRHKDNNSPIGVRHVPKTKAIDFRYALRPSSRRDPATRTTDHRRTRCPPAARCVPRAQVKQVITYRRPSPRRPIT